MIKLLHSEYHTLTVYNVQNILFTYSAVDQFGGNKIHNRRFAAPSNSAQYFYFFALVV